MNPESFDLAVIGGGAAGMLAAGRAAELGKKVVLLDKNNRLGIKLLITGKGRCNITNSLEDIKEFIKIYGPNGKFLRHAMYQFTNQDCISFFEAHGLPLKIERGGRVFPQSDLAGDVVKCLNGYLTKNRVNVRLNSPVDLLLTKQTDSSVKQIEKIVLKNGIEIRAKSYLVATGGKSYPGTGSTGEAYQWLNACGHHIVPPKPALTPVIVSEKWVKELEGLSLKNVEVSLWDHQKISSHFGEALFTSNGMSGPVILDLSKEITELNIKDLSLKIDFKPALDYPTLDKRIQRDFMEQQNKQFKNSLSGLLPRKLIPVMIMLSGIDENKQVNEVTKKERKKLLGLLKGFELHITGLAGFEKAIITSGGVSLKEVDPKTMRSKIVDNLFFAGEVLDIDGPTGGFNLQAAWSTAYLAAESV